MDTPPKVHRTLRRINSNIIQPMSLATSGDDNIITEVAEKVSAPLSFISELSPVFDQSINSDFTASVLSLTSPESPKIDSKTSALSAKSPFNSATKTSPKFKHQGESESTPELIYQSNTPVDYTFNTSLVTQPKGRDCQYDGITPPWSKTLNHSQTTVALHRDLLGIREKGDLRLIYAASAGDVSGVLSLLHLVQLRNHRGMTALMAAACNDNDRCVSILHAYEHSLQANNGMTALMCAAAKGSMRSIPLLIGTEGRLQDKTRRTALMYAAQQGHYECVKMLLDETMLTDASGNTALIIAAMKGHMHCVRYLVEKEGGLRLSSGMTALMLAAHRKDAATVSALTSECKIRDRKGKTALMYAAEAGSAECIEILMTYEKGICDEKGNTALIYAARAGHFECVELLAAFEARHVNAAGYTALMMAACSSSPDCVEALLDSEKGICDKNGRTALMLAVLSENVDTARLLLDEAGFIDNVGNFALVYAVHKRNIEITRLLSSKESRLQTPRGYTALMISASMAHGELVEYLLDGIGIMTNDGYCALYFAIDVYNQCAINLLLPYESHLLGLTPDMRLALCGDVTSLALSLTRNVLQLDRFGRSTLVYAILGNQLKCVELLLSERNVVDKNGWTSIMYAVKKGYIQYLNLLREPNLTNGIESEDILLSIAHRAGHGEIFDTISF